MIATLCVVVSTDADALCSPKFDASGPTNSKEFSRLAVARHILRPPHKVFYNSTTGYQPIRT